MRAFVANTPWVSGCFDAALSKQRHRVASKSAGVSLSLRQHLAETRAFWLGGSARALWQHRGPSSAAAPIGCLVVSDGNYTGPVMSGLAEVAFEGSLVGRGPYQREPRFTSLETNASILEVGTARIFIDPHLVGPLVFLDPRFFAQYKNKLHVPDTERVQEMRQRIREQFGRMTCIVLSQALADHAHEPTLRYLDRQTLIVAPHSARPLLDGLGFRNVRYLHPGEDCHVSCGPEDSSSEEYVEIRAVKGSVVGPPWQNPENGYIFRLYRPCEPSAGLRCVFRMFYEPHGNFDEAELRAALASSRDADGRLVDVVLAPPVRVIFAGFYELLRGAPSASELVRILRPRMVIPIRNWEGRQSGFLSMLLRGNGSLADFREKITETARQVGIDEDLVRVGEPGTAFSLPLCSTGN